MTAGLEQYELEVADRVSDILMVLAELSDEGFHARLPPLDETDPFGVLYGAINETIDALTELRARSQLYQRELAEKVEMIERQRAAIRDLSTPIVELWEKVLCLPVVGIMDTLRTAEVTNTLLEAIVERSASCIIIDITGIEVMDTGTADHFLRMARAVRLLGAECLLTGIGPEIAQTVVQMGVDLSGVTTHRSLRDALMWYLSKQSGTREATKPA